MMPMMRSNNWVPSVFNDLFDVDLMPKANFTAPAINVKESDKSYTVELAAPGMKKEDFNVHINDEGNLMIKMESKNEKKDEDKTTRYLRREFSYTKFEQTLILPDDVKREEITAKVDNGVLTVELPKVVEEKVKVSRQIDIV
ncbi:Hsp20/alpha crystallin family protein [Prevotella sp. lc2012]|uniref:Hsp20/alpha crystallin family protein n=1 Tax=Prevotella sp. lc2012 TaxID=1761886 RepID=UPI000B8405E4|nr:Hsp20/alpha crystallin family protein [Prevotella sp. lc2012]